MAALAPSTACSRSLTVRMHRSAALFFFANVCTGVDKYEVSLEEQTAVVHTSSLDYDTVLNTIKKTGKTVKSGEADGVTANV